MCESSDNLEYMFISGKRYNSSLLFCNDFIYRRKSSNGSTEYYICNTEKCPARIKMESGIIENKAPKHNHVSDGKEYLKMQLLNDAKLNARESHMSLRECYDKAARNRL